MLGALNHIPFISQHINKNGLAVYVYTFSLATILNKFKFKY